MSSANGAPVSLSQVPGSPSFRTSAVNAIAVIPLLSSDRSGHDNPDTHSSRSFQDLLEALSRYHTSQNASEGSIDIATTLGGGRAAEDLLLVVPNSNLTRPGDWKYEETPLKNFHWGHGCQRMSFFDGRPYNSRMAHDRLINHELTRNWIDLCPHRRTAAVIGVLNVRDCPDDATLKQAQEEWQQWAERYSTPPYEVSAHGRDLERDTVVQRLFVFDSFHDSNKVDVSARLKGASLVAFPPTTEEHRQMMDLHMNVVMNDLAVSIFRELEGKILSSDKAIKGNESASFTSPTKSRFFKQRSSGKVGATDDGAPTGSDNLSISNLAAVVSPDSKLAARDGKSSSPSARTSIQTKFPSAVIKNTTKGASTQAQLLTPMDDVFDFAELSPKDAHEMSRREVGRREKFAADLSLLAGSPLDAYERYMKAANLCRSTCPDPLWYAAALEGCVSAHIAMAEMGGFNVDDYLENSFQLPESIMSCAVVPSGEKSNKQDLPSIVVALCDDALDILSRHSRLACFRAELLLKLAWYGAEVEDTHVRCQWGLGEGCYGGDPNETKRRWEMASATQLNFLELKNKRGEDVIARNTFLRCQKFSSYLHQAVAAGALDSVTRADVALRCASLCLKGLRVRNEIRRLACVASRYTDIFPLLPIFKPTTKPTVRNPPDTRLTFHRKAAFFGMVAAESISEAKYDSSVNKVGSLWRQAAFLLSGDPNENDCGRYGWAALRAVALHGLAMQGLRDSSEDAAVQLLALMGDISPQKSSKGTGLLSKFEEEDDTSIMDESTRSDVRGDSASYIGTGESVVSAARTYVRETRAKVAEARRANFFTGMMKDSSLLTVAQSKWVEDEEIPTILLPMAEFSEISESIIAMRCVWTGIRFENCFASQKRIVKEISDLRAKVPASSISAVTDGDSQSLPIEIVSVKMVDSQARSKLERVRIKTKDQQSGAMATFFNPYANKKDGTEAVIVPEDEEQYVLVKFANDLSIPLEISRCQLEFDKAESDRIKAPAISFVIPGQTKDFAVQFPFLVLNMNGSGGDSDKSERIFEVKGLHLSCLARSFFLSLKAPESLPVKKILAPKIPKPASMYSLRDSNEQKVGGNTIVSPKVEVVPAQPNLLVSFASSITPIEEGSVIPIPIADGEIFKLPKLFLSNDLGISGGGKIHELNISASGLPGVSDPVIFTLTKPEEKKEEEFRVNKKAPVAIPLVLEASCENMDSEALNDPQKKKKSSLSLKLIAKPDMGAHIRGCTVKLSFRYRGATPSPTMEVWRRHEIEIRILRIKGPRMSSLTFRPDLNWESCFHEMCLALSKKDENPIYRPGKIQVDRALPQAGSTDRDEFVLGRLGTDNGVHVCGDKVFVFVAISNESNVTIALSSSRGTVGGFDGSTMQTVKVNPGVSAKIPIVLPRIERASGIDEKIVAMTKLSWASEVCEKPDEVDPDIHTGGTIVPINRRERMGSIEIPMPCLKTIIDENPIFLSRACKAPCTIAVGGSNTSGAVTIGKPFLVTIDIDLADWIPDSLLQETKQTLEFCCVRKGSSDIKVDRKSHKDFVWSGHTRKTLGDGNKNHKHRARLVFLEEGDYAVSACLSFSRFGMADQAKEVWWAEKAQLVHVTRAPVGQ